MDPAKRLNEIKKKNPWNPSLAYININSIRYKHNELFTRAQNNIDMLAIVEAELDSSFPSAQFLVHGYKTHTERMVTNMVVGCWFMLKKIFHAANSQTTLQYIICLTPLLLS